MGRMGSRRLRDGLFAWALVAASFGGRTSPRDGPTSSVALDPRRGIASTASLPICRSISWGYGLHEEDGRAPAEVICKVRRGSYAPLHFLRTFGSKAAAGGGEIGGCRAFERAPLPPMNRIDGRGLCSIARGWRSCL